MTLVYPHKHVFLKILSKLMDDLCNKCKLRYQSKVHWALREVFQVLRYRYYLIKRQCGLITSTFLKVQN